MLQKAAFVGRRVWFSRVPRGLHQGSASNGICWVDLLVPQLGLDAILCVSFLLFRSKVAFGFVQDFRNGEHVFTLGRARMKILVLLKPKVY